jgi:hypothetical protein
MIIELNLKTETSLDSDANKNTQIDWKPHHQDQILLETSRRLEQRQNLISDEQQLTKCRNKSHGVRTAYNLKPPKQASTLSASNKWTQHERERETETERDQTFEPPRKKSPLQKHTRAHTHKQENSSILSETRL